MHPAVDAQNRVNVFVRHQLEVDALIDLPDDWLGGDIGPRDAYFEFGMRWWVLTCSGLNLAAVSDVTRRAIQPHVDRDLTLEDCIAGMAGVLNHLQSLDRGEYEKTVDGMVRARRHVRRGLVSEGGGLVPEVDSARATGGTPGAPRTRAVRRRQGTRSTGARVADSRRPAGRHADLAGEGWPFGQEQYLLQVHLAESAIDALRTVPPGSAPDWEPTKQDKELVGIGDAYSAFHHLVLAYAVGGARGLARVSDICGPFPTISATQALGGLQETHRRLAQLDDEDRATAFAAIDFALRWFDPS